MSSVLCHRLVSGSRDATLRVWDIESGHCLHVLIGHVAAVRCVQYDGRRVVSGAYDYMVKIWDPESETCLQTLSGHTNRVYSLQVQYYYFQFYDLWMKFGKAKKWSEMNADFFTSLLHWFLLYYCLPRSPGQPQHRKYQNRMWWILCFLHIFIVFLAPLKSSLNCWWFKICGCFKAPTHSHRSHDMAHVCWSQPVLLSYTQVTWHGTCVLITASIALLHTGHMTWHMCVDHSQYCYSGSFEAIVT